MELHYDHSSTLMHIISGVCRVGWGVQCSSPVHCLSIEWVLPRKDCTPFSSGLPCPSDGFTDRPSLVWGVDPPTPTDPQEKRRREGRSDGVQVSSASVSHKRTTGTWEDPSPPPEMKGKKLLLGLIAHMWLRPSGATSWGCKRVDTRPVIELNVRERQSSALLTLGSSMGEYLFITWPSLLMRNYGKMTERRNWEMYVGMNFHNLCKKSVTMNTWFAFILHYHHS